MMSNEISALRSTILNNPSLKARLNAYMKAAKKNFNEVNIDVLRRIVNLDTDQFNNFLKNFETPSTILSQIKSNPSLKARLDIYLKTTGNTEDKLDADTLKKIRDTSSEEFSALIKSSQTPSTILSEIKSNPNLKARLDTYLKTTGKTEDKLDADTLKKIRDTSSEEFSALIKSSQTQEQKQESPKKSLLEVTGSKEFQEFIKKLNNTNIKTQDEYNKFRNELTSIISNANLSDNEKRIFVEFAKNPNDQRYINEIYRLYGGNLVDALRRLNISFNEYGSVIDIASKQPLTVVDNKQPETTTKPPETTTKPPETTTKPPIEFSNPTTQPITTGGNVQTTTGGVNVTPSQPVTIGGYGETRPPNITSGVVYPGTGTAQQAPTTTNVQNMMANQATAPTPSVGIYPFYPSMPQELVQRQMVDLSAQYTRGQGTPTFERMDENYIRGQVGRMKQWLDYQTQQAAKEQNRQLQARGITKTGFAEGLKAQLARQNAADIARYETGLRDTALSQRNTALQQEFLNNKALLEYNNMLLEKEKADIMNMANLNNAQKEQLITHLEAQQEMNFNALNKLFENYLKMAEVEGKLRAEGANVESAGINAAANVGRLGLEALSNISMGGFGQLMGTLGRAATGGVTGGGGLVGAHAGVTGGSPTIYPGVAVQGAAASGERAPAQSLSFQTVAAKNANPLYMNLTNTNKNELQMYRDWLDDKGRISKQGYSGVGIVDNYWR